MMKKIKQNTFLDYQFISGLKSNKSHSLVGFIVSKIKKSTNSYNKSLYLYDGKEVSLFEENVNNFIFNQDDLIIFKNGRYTRYNQQLQEVESFKLPIEAGAIVALSNNKYLVHAQIDLNCVDYYKMNEKERNAFNKKRKEESSFQVIDEYPFFFNGQGYINKTRNALFLYESNSEQMTMLTPNTLDVEGFDIDGSQILFFGLDYKEFKGKTSQIYTYDFNTMVLDTLYNQDDAMINKVFYKDHQPYVAATKGKRFGFMENPIFYKIENNQLIEFYDADLSLYNSVGSDCRYGGSNSYLNYQGKPYFISTSKDSSAVFCLEDTYKQVNNELGSTDGFAFINEKLIVVGMFDMKLQEVYVYENNIKQQITTFNEDIFDNYYVSKPINHQVKVDNAIVDGFVLLPYKYDNNKKYPLILDVHGGPKAAYGPVFYHEMQMWASMGYIVVYANPSGSDGKGNVFADLRGSIGKKAYNELMKFVDDVIAQYSSVDANNMAITGGSYGGYMTNYVIGHTDRFKCAMSQRSISNWISMVTASDYGIDFPIEQEYEDIYNAHDELWNESPLKYANNVTTPTLFIHSYEDYRCPFAEAVQLYTVLKCRGVDTRICGFKNENHELSRSGKPKARIRRLQELNDWLNKYIEGGN